jgi:hypothetical protein
LLTASFSQFDPEQTSWRAKAARPNVNHLTHGLGLVW